VREVTARLGRLAGVEAVSFSENGIFSGTESANTFQVPGYVARAESDTSAYYDHIGPGYVRAIGGRLLEGRDFTEQDARGTPAVAMVNQTMARFYWPRESAVGKTIRMDTVSIEVVGVVADVKDHQLDAEPLRRFYLAYIQHAVEDAASLRFIVRTSGDPGLLTVPVRAELKGLDAELRIDDVSPLSQLMRDSIAENRLLARLAAVLGALALLLAAVGLYGLMSFATSRRTGEIGLRMALGARQGDVLRMVLLEAFKLVGIGLVIGVPFAFAATRLLRNQLFDVPAGDPVSITAAIVVLTGAAAIAALVPAMRAARVDPMAALRNE
jgi:predicted permease